MNFSRFLIHSLKITTLLISLVRVLYETIHIRESLKVSQKNILQEQNDSLCKKTLMYPQEKSKVFVLLNRDQADEKLHKTIRGGGG